MSWNKDGAISYAKSHAQPSSTGNCARSIRAGGRLKLPNTRLAKDMGRTLVNAGFHRYMINPMLVTSQLSKI